MGDVKIVLKPCKTCGREISTNATKCPHCGERNPTATPFNEKGTAGKAADITTMIFVIICAIIIFIVLLAFL